MACCAQIIKVESVFSGMTSYIFSTMSAGRPSFSSIGHVMHEKGYRVAWFSHVDNYA